MGKFKYQERSEEASRERQQQQTGGFDSIIKDSEIFKPKEGENNIRILPPTWDFKEHPDQENWAWMAYLHRDIGADKSTYLCLEKNNKGKCPICEARHGLRDEELAKALKPKTSMMAYIIDRDDEKSGPKIWMFSNKMEVDIQLLADDKQEGILKIDHPDEGYDISFVRTGTKLNTRYNGIQVARRSSPLADRQKDQDKWLDFIQDNPIPELLDFKTYDYLKQVYEGKRSTKESSEETSDRPTRSSMDREEPKSRRGRDDDTEEEDRRGRGREREEPESRNQRGRREEPEEDDRSTRNRRGRDDDRDNRSARPSRTEEEEDTRKGSSRDRDEDASRRGRRDEPEKEDKPKSTRPQSRRQEDDDDEIPSKRDRSPAQEEDDPEETPRGERAKRGKETLNKLKPKD